MSKRMTQKAATCGGQAFDIKDDAEMVSRLNALIELWREGPLAPVRSCDVCPDWSNRAQTGLSVDHVHYVATLMADEGFKSRRRCKADTKGVHDVPVLVRETASSELGRGALAKWRAATATNRGFPPFLLEGHEEFFCSLGSGHFSQALNLFRSCSKSLWSDRRYDAGTDEALREALEEGVESVVLSPEMPVEDRRFVSEMLNRSHGRRWSVGDDGRVEIDEAVSSSQGGMFVALSKVLDAEELSCLVRQRVGVSVERSEFWDGSAGTVAA